MIDHVTKKIGFLKTTAIGGLVFLLPLIVIGFLLGQLAPIVLSIAKFLNETLGFKTANGYLILLGLSVLVIVLLCFAAGIVARWTIGQRIGGFVERNLTLIFPRYSIYKDQLAGGLDADALRGRMMPALVHLDGVTRPVLEIERSLGGKVTIYLPGAPDPWSGTIGFVDETQITPIETDLGEYLNGAAPPAVPAFPGAEGYGASTPGGRGGKVIAVTNLNASGPGSLQAACSEKGPRIVVFRVAGTIDGNVKIKNDYITIAGQTAPGDGVTLKGNIAIDANHVVIRYLRVRADSSGDAVGCRYKHHIVLDHLSASWSTDEVMSVYHCEDVTIQWCLISEAGSESHKFGGIWGSNRGTHHHNLFANNYSRNPRFASGGGLNDFRNNVIYNWQHQSIYGGEAHQPGNDRFSSFSGNLIANYYKAGPGTQDGVRSRILDPSTRNGEADAGQWWVSDNFVAGFPEVTADNWKGVTKQDDHFRLSEPWPAMPIKQQTAEQAYHAVLEQVGCTLPTRDAIDARIIRDVRNGVGSRGENGFVTNQEEAGGWVEMKTGQPPADTDNDGMPDQWEVTFGLDPHDDGDNTQDSDNDGYTNVEEYLNGGDPTQYVDYTIGAAAFLWGGVLPASEKPRVIVTSDGEIDDECSLVRFLLYANEWDVEGIITSSSQYHWRGHRWAGDDWAEPYLQAYAEVQPNLVKHDPRYPTAEFLRARTLLGNVDAEGEMEKTTPGSTRIVEVLLDDSDSRPVWLQAWGGTNTIARALKTIEERHPERMAEVAQKTRFFFIWEQDDAYQSYIRPHWGRYEIPTIICDQFWSIAYQWNKILPQDKQEYFKAEWMKTNILENHGPLCSLYKAHVPGSHGLSGDTDFTPGDFRSEGDSPAFLHVIPTGLRSTESPGYGGWGGRYTRVRGATWLDPVPDPKFAYPAGRWYTRSAWGRKYMRDTYPKSQDLMRAYFYPLVRWTDAVQNDFAARADWCVATYADANHPPVVASPRALDVSVSPGEGVPLSIKGSRDPDGDQLTYRWWRYTEADTYPGKVEIQDAENQEAAFTVPADAASGATIHVVCEVTDTGAPPLTRYQRTIVKVK
ncbi:unnamed protein product [Ostreobium quekettii]|uniref:Pectin lyase fold/virulence factor n=1 Tax=Ostreobium quekettii TaxID=121088 RepID=A0A8S1IMK6_9CHLO|nr:unnamed protein product [Ostreobium quekettii]